MLYYRTNDYGYDDADARLRDRQVLFVANVNPHLNKIKAASKEGSFFSLKNLN